MRDREETAGMQDDPFGTHRVLEPLGSMPQPAWRLENSTHSIFPSEILVAVRTLNIDAASFRQMLEDGGGDPSAVSEKVLATVRERGKQHNPVTGSGGMLLGRVERVGEDARARGFRVGDEVATLASLTLTPLALQRVHQVRAESAQLDVEGWAVVFGSAPLARMPTDFPERVALALFDVAGAASQVERLTGAGEDVVVLGGGGKSGLLACVQARLSVGPRGRVVALETNSAYADELLSLGVCDSVLREDARDVRRTWSALQSILPEGAHLVVSCVNVPGVELLAALATRSRGSTYYFSMSTSFAAAALGAEGIGKDIRMYIGNGYAEGHAEHTLALVRSHPRLLSLLQKRYA